MKRICSWCKKDMGETPEGDPDLITHGICEDCKREQEKELEELEREMKNKNKSKNPEIKIR